MAPRTGATLGKRQREHARQEKQQAKLQRKLQRRLEKRESPPGPESGELASAAEVPALSEPFSCTTLTASPAIPDERPFQ